MQLLCPVCKRKIKVNNKYPKKGLSTHIRHCKKEINYFHKYTKAGLIKQFKWLVKKVGHLPKRDEIRQYKHLGMPHPDTYHNYFGGYSSFLQTMGYKPHHIKKYDKKYLLEILQLLEEELGRIPNTEDFEVYRTSKWGKKFKVIIPDVTAYLRHFGSWAKTYKAYGKLPKCKICGIEIPVIERHHIIPKSKGGTDETENIINLCPNCHKKIHWNIIDISGKEVVT